MYVLKRVGLMAAGFTLGCGISWSADDSLIWGVRSYLGMPLFNEPDYLKQVSSAADLSLVEKRKEFMQALTEKGPSPHLSLLISDFSKRAFMHRAEQDEDNLSRMEELELLEGLMRKQYPHLFDETSGREFLAKLNLKLYCDDHYTVPKFLRPIRS